MKWLAQVDSNHRPRAYQARALTTWAMSQYRGRPRSRDSPSFFSFRSSCARNCHLHFWFFCVRLPKRWWRWWDSNPWPPACRAGALPAELHPHIYGTLLFSPKDPSKLNNESIYSDKTVILCRIHIVMYGRFSIERRWSSRTFRYGYLVTT